MISEPQTEERPVIGQPISQKNLTRLKILGLIFTLGGIALFSYFIYIEGLHDIADDVEHFGWIGFAGILSLYFLRILSRAWAWKLSVYEPYELSLKDTIPAVMIGEALSALIPLGILISGTSKAVAVRKRVPLVVGLSSVATENLFYSLITSLFLILGAITFLRTFHIDEAWTFTLDVIIGVIIAVVALIIAMIIRQWHFASYICEWLYDHSIGRRFLEHGRLHVRLFENLIYGFYRRYPRRFLPICGFEIAFHLLGIIEAYFILGFISELGATWLSSFLLESVSRLILVVFKLIPFLVGVDEAGAKFVTEVLGLGAGVGITLAIIRKGRVLFWTAIGLILILKRGLSLKEITEIRERIHHSISPQ
ncbi:MAG TPA: lysylphosphatidylglycerol synthase domain-containing protein [Pyrinomonadaceae bacterium]|nr:lysylphosphatidylglycerol synthase domain-containing protein [Pyrinomonadaceae bacterium]